MPKYNDFFEDKNGEKVLKEDKQTLIEGWARDGLSEKQIAQNMGIAYSTFCEWKKKFPVLSEVLKKTKAVADYQVENTLFKRATGSFKVTNMQFKMVKRDPDVIKAERATLLNQFKIDHPNATKSDLQVKMLEIMQKVETYKRIKIAETVTEIPPDTSAAMFWLKNRRPDVFRDQTFKKLNEAQARKALADAEIAEMESKKAKEQSNSHTIINFLPPKLPDEEESQDASQTNDNQ